MPVDGRAKCSIRIESMHSNTGGGFLAVICCIVLVHPCLALKEGHLCNGVH